MVGIWLDRKLNFRHHVMLKTASVMRAIQRLANCETGPTPAAVRQLYLACIVPVSGFGAETGGTIRKHTVTNSKKIQNAAL